MNMKRYDDADGLHMVLMRLDEWDEHERLANERIAALEAGLAAARAAAHAWKRAAKWHRKQNIKGLQTALALYGVLAQLARWAAAWKWAATAHRARQLLQEMVWSETRKPNVAREKRLDEIIRKAEAAYK